MAYFSITIARWFLSVVHFEESILTNSEGFLLGGNMENISLNSLSIFYLIRSRMRYLFACGLKQVFISLPYPVLLDWEEDFTISSLSSLHCGFQDKTLEIFYQLWDWALVR